MSQSCSQEQGLSPLDHWIQRLGEGIRWLLCQNLYCSGTIVCTTNVTSCSTLRTSGRVKRIMGSTAILSLFLTQSSESSFRSFFLMKSSALSRKLRSNTRLLSSPCTLINQLDQLHLQLFSTWTTSRKGTTNSNSDGSSLLSAMSLKQTSAFLLHSSQSVATATTTNFWHITFLSKQASHALNDGIRETFPLYLQVAQTDFDDRHSSHLLIAKQYEVSLDTICLTLRWTFKQFSQVCTVLMLSFMQENISSPVTDLGRKKTATVIAAPLSSEVAIVTSALVIRLIFIFSGSGRGCFFTNFSSTLSVRPITCFCRGS